jgi:hypothetical protein
MALIDRAKIVLGAGLAAIMPVSLGYAQRPASVFAVSNVRVQAEAANAVEAKKIATLNAETQAFRLLVGRLADFRVQSRIPEVPPQDVERLVSDISVRNEGVSNTTYVATFAISFSERAIGALFAQYGTAPIVDRGPEILIVPVYVEAGEARTADRNPWRNALTQLDLTHALVPAKIAPVRGDLTAPVANAYIANPDAGIETLKSQYHVTQILLAVAEMGGNGETLNIKLAGYDALGSFNLQRQLKSPEGVDEALMLSAAKLTLETVQERWKLTRSGVSGVGAGASADGTTAFSGNAGGDSATLEVTAQFSGLKEWQSIRGRLQSIPGIQNWDLKSVNPRGAVISFDFPGGVERLTGMAAAQGLSVENGAEGLVVRTR